MALTEDGGREGALQFRQGLTFELPCTFARGPKLAADRRQRGRFVVEAEEQFDQALFALGRRPHRSDDGVPPIRRQRLRRGLAAAMRRLIRSHR